MNPQHQPFDPYQQWLGILPEEQPANYYRLLFLSDFESNEEVIDTAAERTLAYLRQCGTHEHDPEAQALMNKIGNIRLCLLDPFQKAAYDEELRKQQDGRSNPVPPDPFLELASHRPLQEKTTTHITDPNEAIARMNEYSAAILNEVQKMNRFQILTFMMGVLFGVIGLMLLIRLFLRPEMF